jgi:molybdopterin synthase catalytic subunit
MSTATHGGPTSRARIALAQVIETEPDVGAHQRAIEDPGAGARVVFLGVVRDHDHDREVTRLEYSAHPSAEKVLREIISEFVDRDGVVAIAVTHRLGALEIGDTAMVVAVSSVRRREGFDACSDLVDEIKHRLPVWKRQVFADGTEEWVNCP